MQMHSSEGLVTRNVLFAVCIFLVTIEAFLAFVANNYLLGLGLYIHRWPAIWSILELREAVVELRPNH
jgi:hypothetical protein